jgi:ribonuclease HI
MPNTLPHITIYTDGGADPNPGAGGWGAILIQNNQPRELSGGSDATTNNRMELTAAIEALRALDGPHRIDFYSDSEYVVKGISERIDKWLRQGRFEAGEVPNADLWQTLHRLVQPHDITWHWVRGHAGNIWNERADELATAARPTPERFLDANRTRVILMIAGAKKNFGYAAAVVRDDDLDSAEILTGIARDTSPNLFILSSAIAVLEQLPAEEPLYFFTNSSYLFDGITKWIHGWKKNGFKKFALQWKQLDVLCAGRDVQWVSFKNNAPPPEAALLTEPLARARQRAGG